MKDIDVELDERAFDLLQEKYGKVQNNWKSRFNGEYKNGIVGWQIDDKKTRVDSDQKGEALEIDIALPTDVRACPNNCGFCFVNGDPNREVKYCLQNGKKKQSSNTSMGFRRL